MWCFFCPLGTLLPLGSLPTFGRSPVGTHALYDHQSWSDPWVDINPWVVRVSTWLSLFSALHIPFPNAFSS